MMGAALFALLPWPLALAGLGFGLALLLLAILDMTHFWLPDRITLPLAAAGMGCAIAGLGPDPLDAAIGAVAGYVSLAIVAFGYARLRGRVGLGGGDPKLFAAIGVWVGWASLPMILTIAASIGLVALLILRVAGRKAVRRDQQIPFGTLLAIAAWPFWIAVMH